MYVSDKFPVACTCEVEAEEKEEEERDKQTDRNEWAT